MAYGNTKLENPQEASTESLFGTMDKTLRLLEMGFSENRISAAIEKYGELSRNQYFNMHHFSLALWV